MRNTAYTGENKQVRFRGSDEKSAAGGLGMDETGDGKREAECSVACGGEVWERGQRCRYRVGCLLDSISLFSFPHLHQLQPTTQSCFRYAGTQCLQNTETTCINTNHLILQRALLDEAVSNINEFK